MGDGAVAPRDGLRTAPTVEAGIVYTGSISDENTIVIYEPGDGYRYELMFTETAKTSQRSLRKLDWERGTVVVTWLNGGRAMVLAPTGFMHPQYVREKLGCGADTAVVLAELFVYLLPGRRAVASE